MVVEANIDCPLSLGKYMMIYLHTIKQEEVDGRCVSWFLGVP